METGLQWTRGDGGGRAVLEMETFWKWWWRLGACSLDVMALKACWF